MTQHNRRALLSGQQPGDRLEHFLAEYNLYQRCYMEQIFGDETGPNVTYIANALTPIRVMLSCPTCKEKRPFRRVEGRPPAEHYQREPRPGRGNGDTNDGEVFYIYLVCAYCLTSEFQCWIQVRVVTDQPGEPYAWLQKVGQVPQWNIVLSSDLEAALADDAELYKRAQITKTFSYGVGSCAYLRRVLENRITPLLNMVYEIRKEDGASEADLLDIRTIMEGKIAEVRSGSRTRCFPNR